MELTDDTYYTEEADRRFLSCSQIQEFTACEAAAMAKIYGLYSPPESEALTVGRYFHARMEGDEAYERFLAENKDKVFLRTGGKRAPYVQADKMVEALMQDDYVRALIDAPGEVEKIYTGSIFDAKWKIKVDKYFPQNRVILDWKTVACLTDSVYNPTYGVRESFIEAREYMMRTAVYTEVERQITGASDRATFVIVAVDKQDPPDKGVYDLTDDSRLDEEIERLRVIVPRILDVKAGRSHAVRCGKCPYCRETKRIAGVQPYTVLSPGNPGIEYEREYDDVFTFYRDEARRIAKEEGF